MSAPTGRRGSRSLRRVAELPLTIERSFPCGAVERSKSAWGVDGLAPGLSRQELGVGLRLCRHRLLGEAIEEQATMAREAAVVAEDELVQVGIEELEASSSRSRCPRSCPGKHARGIASRSRPEPRSLRVAASAFESIRSRPGETRMPQP